MPYNLVKLIAQEDGVKYSSDPFEFTGDLTRNQRILKLNKCQGLKDPTPIYFTDQFLIQNPDGYEVNIFVHKTEPDILLRLNGLK